MMFRSGYISLLLFLAVTLAQAQEVTMVVNETAGLHRSNFPAGTIFQWPEAVPRSTQFKLLHGDRVLPAQFLPAESGEHIRRFQVDFRVTLPPYASREFKVQRLETGETSPEIRGFRLQRSRDGITLTNRPYLHWKLDTHLQGILQEFQFEEYDFWDPSASRLVLKLNSGDEVEVTGNSKVELKVLKEGPWSTRLGYSVQASQLGLNKVHSNVTLSFDVSRSWVQVDWQVYDPGREVKALAVPMKLKLDAPTRQAPTLIDFGTTTQLYSRLAGNESAELRSHYFKIPKEGKYTWEVRQGAGKQWKQLAVGAQQPGDRFHAEGWAHVMDSKKCLALAVDKFGHDANDVIRLSADGAVYLQRTPVAREHLGASKYIHLRYWLHFVFNPQEVSAATSPQSMKAPLAIHLK